MITLAFLIGSIPLLVASGVLFETLAESPLVQKTSLLKSLPFPWTLFLAGALASIISLIFILESFHKPLGLALTLGGLVAMGAMKMAYRSIRKQ
jgi:hypothetical protein